jgi:DNA-binding transcriptional LysR family regulator
MTNIPTDLLRTLVAVVDLRSFTKAGASLGLTQPAVSAQIKRLQFLLGGDVFDRSVQGISLTPHGEMVVSYARRLLSINDQIVHLGAGAPRPELVIRIGTSGDYIASVLPGALAWFRERWPDVRFVVRNECYDPLLRELRSGALDVMVGQSLTPQLDAHQSWEEEMVWVRGAKTRLESDRPVPLVSYGEPCAYHQLAVSTLKTAGLQWEEVFTGPSVASLAGAVAAGLGVMAISRYVANEVGMTIWEDAPLPMLAPIHCGVYLREGGARTAYEQLADEIAATLRAPLAGAPKLVAIDQPRKTSPAA